MKFYSGLIQGAYELGIRVIDTAEVYAHGLSEEIIGSLPPSINSELFIMTKFSAKNSLPENMTSALHSSLKRLKRECVDVYQPHWPNVNVNTESVISSLVKLVEQGKVKHIGLSNFPLDEYRKANHFSKTNKIEFMQASYGPYDRLIESELLPEIKRNNSILVGYSPFGTGSVFSKQNKNYRTLTELAENYSCSLSQIILAWILRSGSVISIPKSNSIERIVDNFSALKLKLKAVDIEYLSKIFSTKVELININLIDIQSNGDQKNYENIEDAINNSLKLFPGPMDVAEEIKNNNGNLAKPIKIKRKRQSKRFILVEGRVKYWAWRILYGDDSKIPALFIE
jgi:diketogulonate reductase-like aldo/keto reductase